MIIKLITEIVDAIQIISVRQLIQKQINQQGRDQFNNKFIKFNKNFENQNQQHQNQQKKQYFQASQEQIYKHYSQMSKKYIEGQNNLEQKYEKTNMTAFLLKYVLAPLNKMLFFKKLDQDEKSRVTLSVAIVRILTKFTIDTFMHQFRKVLSKLCRLLKKRNKNIRDNARKCLAAISQITGPELSHCIITQMKYHLKDNFEHHILNYSIWYIIDSMTIRQNGSLDYCLPLILPIIVDQIFGQASSEKLMVQQSQIPTLVFEAKKRKGYELTTLLSKHISPMKIEYLIHYLSQVLIPYLNSQANINKYDLLVNSFISGLASNKQFLMSKNSDIYLRILSKGLQKYQIQDEIEDKKDKKLKHQTTIIQTIKKQNRKGKKQAFQLQPQAGRNQSIFKKISKQVTSKRNIQILNNCTVQFYLSLIYFILKKK